MGVNGVKEGSNPAPITFTGTNSTGISLRTSIADEADLDGLLDQAKVFSCALTAAEIKADYDATK